MRQLLEIGLLVMAIGLCGAETVWAQTGGRSGAGKKSTPSSTKQPTPPKGKSNKGNGKTPPSGASQAGKKALAGKTQQGQPPRIVKQTARGRAKEIVQGLGKVISLNPVTAILKAAFKPSKIGLDPQEEERLKAQQQQDRKKRPSRSRR